MIRRLLCLVFGHSFEKRPQRIMDYLHGDCARCRRYVVIKERSR